MIEPVNQRKRQVVVLVGNPKPASRTLAAAQHVAEVLIDGPADAAIDLVTLGPALLDAKSDALQAAVEQVRAADVLVVASPTYKASFAGILKVFLDQIPGGGLTGVNAFAVMLGAGPGHALAPEVFLKPVLVELGASCPAPGLYLLDSDFRSETVLTPWAHAARTTIRTDRPRRT